MKLNYTKVIAWLLLIVVGVALWNAREHRKYTLEHEAVPAVVPVTAPVTKRHSPKLIHVRPWPSPRPMKAKKIKHVAEPKVVKTKAKLPAKAPAKQPRAKSDRCKLVPAIAYQHPPAVVIDAAIAHGVTGADLQTLRRCIGAR